MTGTLDKKFNLKAGTYVVDNVGNIYLCHSSDHGSARITHLGTYLTLDKPSREFIPLCIQKGDFFKRGLKHDTSCYKVLEITFEKDMYMKGYYIKYYVAYRGGGDESKIKLEDFIKDIVRHKEDIHDKT